MKIAKMWEWASILLIVFNLVLGIAALCYGKWIYASINILCVVTLIGSMEYIHRRFGGTDHDDLP